MTATSTNKVTVTVHLPEYLKTASSTPYVGFRAVIHTAKGKRTMHDILAFRPSGGSGGGGGGWREWSPPPLNLSWSWKPMQSVRDRSWQGPITPPPLECGWRHTGNVQGGCACECLRVGVLFNFSEGGWRHADNVQRGEGCLWMFSR